jgi:hypothetical protein
MNPKTVRGALVAAKVCGHLDYPENKGGKGHSHQFTFYETPLPTGGFRTTKPPSTLEGLGNVAATADAKPSSTARQTLQFAKPNPPVNAPKPSSTLERNSLNSLNSSLNSNVPLPSVADTLPCQSASKIEKAKEEKKASKRTSDGSKPSEFAIINGIAWLPVVDQEERCQALRHHDQLLAKIRELNPGVPVETIKPYTVRRKLNGTGGHA